MSDEGYQNDADQKFHEFHVSMGDRLKDNLYGSFILRVVNAFNKPVTYVREKWIEPMQAKNRGVYYHRQFRRVPTIDECYENDQMCMYEANEQMKRDKNVDKHIVRHLKFRFDDCRRTYGAAAQTRCYQTYEEWLLGKENYMIKWGDLPAQHNAIDVY
ncbi:NADH dehydrogenase [ubiquinone] 1 beta subcomplex subunit 10-like isoform X2 [Ostrea edulis]|uniref:NADH dehydrogenase [ubiquinone] 1 beta subcomplex subunit 10-like isoform X2 n=1 Tax=Ostrea edulis TaxID=37623 RepID=UPI002094FF02|nr:NADH dehydrogenase [ubiquinone] 1 beta subcomplex subunit 10-like isoform X2 [Ostrea edulis]